MSDNLPAQLGTVKTVRDILDTGLPTIEEALPKGMDPTRFIRVVLTVLESNPKLLLCTKSSFFLAVLQCAELGLEPHLSQAYIIPYNNKRKVGERWVRVVEAQFQIGFRGLKELALRSGRYGHIEAQPVWQEDFFKYELGLDPKLVHVPNLDADPGELRNVYSIAWPSAIGARPVFEVMSKRQVDHIRSKSKAEDSPWVTDFSEMARKTVFKRLSKWLELTPEMSRIVERDNRADVGLLPMSASTLLTERAGLDETLRQIGGEALTEIEAPEGDRPANRALEAVSGATAAPDVPLEGDARVEALEAEKARQRALLEEATSSSDDQLPLATVPGQSWASWVGTLPNLVDLDTVLRKLTVPATILEMYSRDTRKTVRDTYISRLTHLLDAIQALELIDGIDSDRVPEGEGTE